MQHRSRLVTHDYALKASKGGRTKREKEHERRGSRVMPTGSEEKGVRREVLGGG